MSYSPSIGDIVLVCQFAWSTFTRFRGAPADFSEIASDWKDIHQVLGQVDQQSKEEWAPMNRDNQSRSAMLFCIMECRATLELLNSQLQRYQSLGTATPKASERVLYITRNFTPLCDRLRQDRDKINAQLSIGTNDVVGRIYRAVSKIAAQMRAGTRERTIINTSSNEADDTWTVITNELQLEDISAEELEAHRAEIELYVRRLQREAAFEENSPDGRSHVEIYPEDSITEVHPWLTDLSFARQGRSPSTGSDLPSISIFRGVPIYEISYRTIFNPNLNSKGIHIPDTFDIWELARLSWSLQRLCTAGIPGLNGKEEESLKTMVDSLTKLDPVLLLLLARSSSDKSFWSDITKSTKKPKSFGDNYIGSIKFDSFLTVGRLLQKRLKLINDQIDQFQIRTKLATSKDPQKERNTTFRPPYKFLKLGRRRSKSTIQASSSHSTGNFQSLGFYDYEPGPLEWEKCISLHCEDISKYVEGNQNNDSTRGILSENTIGITKSKFEKDLKAIESTWLKKYEKAKAIQAPSTLQQAGDDGQTLLLQWLLSAQGLEYYPGDLIDQLSDSLTFKEEPQTPTNLLTSLVMVAAAVFLDQYEDQGKRSLPNRQSQLQGHQQHSHPEASSVIVAAPVEQDLIPSTFTSQRGATSLVPRLSSESSPLRSGRIDDITDQADDEAFFSADEG